MHEYAVVAELISALLPKLEPHPGVVRAVFLKKGELRILSDRALRSAFEILREGTRLADATLEIETVPVSVRCAECGYQGGAGAYVDEALHFAVPVLSCPTCGGPVSVRTGRELVVERVAVESAQDGEIARCRSSDAA